MFCCRYCLPHGDYTLELEDSELAIEFQRNAEAIFYYPSPTVFNQQANVTLFGTMTEQISLQPAEYDNTSDSNNDDDDASIYIIPVVVMFGVAIIGGILWYVFYLKSNGSYECSFICCYFIIYSPGTSGINCLNNLHFIITTHMMKRLGRAKMKYCECNYLFD